MSTKVCPKCEKNSLVKSYNETLELCDTCLNQEYNKLLNKVELHKDIDYEAKGDVVKTKELLELMKIEHEKKQKELLEQTTQSQEEIAELNDKTQSIPISYENEEALEKAKKINSVSQIVMYGVVLAILSYLSYLAWV